MGHKVIKNSLDSKLQIFSMFPIIVLIVLEVKEKTSFFLNRVLEYFLYSIANTYNNMNDFISVCGKHVFILSFLGFCTSLNAVKPQLKISLISKLWTKKYKPVSLVSFSAVSSAFRSDIFVCQLSLSE